MKFLPALLILTCVFGMAHSQSVGIGIENPNGNAVLHLVSPGNNQGLLVPQLTTAQRTASTFTTNLGTADNGLLVFDIDERRFYYWNINQWLTLDNDNGNEIQTLSLSGTTLSLSNGGGSVNLPAGGGGITAVSSDGTLTGDGTSTSPLGIADNAIDGNKIANGSITNADISNVNWSKITNRPAGLDDGDDVNDADASSTNELQTLSLSGDQLSLSNGGGTVTLPSGGGGINFVTSDATLSGDGTSGNPLSLADNSVTGTKIVNNSIQNADINSLNWNKLTNLPAGLDDGDDVDDADADPNNEIQTISKSGNTVSLSNGGGSFTDAVNDADANPSNELQTISLSGDQLSLSNGGGTVTLPSGGGGINFVTSDATLSGDGTTGNPLGLADNSVTGIKIVNNSIQNADINSLNWNKLTNLPAGLDDGDDVDDADADATNELQTISKSGNTVTLSNGGGSFTDAVNDADFDPANELQTISKSGNTVTLSNGGGSFNDAVNDADANATNEIQTITRNGDNVELSLNGGSASVLDYSPAAFKATTSIIYDLTSVLTTIVFDVPIYDITGDYNANGGEFVVPADGIYTFKSMVTFDGSHFGTTYFFLVVNDTQARQQILVNDSNPTVYFASEVNLVAGDRVKIQTFHVGDNIGTSTNPIEAVMFFSGRRVY